MKYKITHMTSAHPRYDTRIFLKECVSLSKIDKYEVNLIVADGLGNEFKNAVHIYDVGSSKGRLDRIFKISKQVYNQAVILDSDIYHFHDPELIPIAVKLKKNGKKVIFDIHEHTSLQILNKEHIPSFFRKPLSFFYTIYEKMFLKNFDYLILAEESYFKYYKKISPNVEIILNMPDLIELDKYLNHNRMGNEIFYVGGISKDRGLIENIEALRILIKIKMNIFFHYIGKCHSKNLENLEINDLKDNLKFYGLLPLPKALEYSRNSSVGVSILKPIANYKNSYSTKIFEYMAIGLPIVTSNFELYKNVVEKYNCGLCVNPDSPEEISNAILYILDNPKIAKKMSLNGRSIVEKKYNWEIQNEKLINIYNKI